MAPTPFLPACGERMILLCSSAHPDNEYRPSLHDGYVEDLDPMGILSIAHDES